MPTSLNDHRILKDSLEQTNENATLEHKHGIIKNYCFGQTTGPIVAASFFAGTAVATKSMRGRILSAGLAFALFQLGENELEQCKKDGHKILENMESLKNERR